METETEQVLRMFYDEQLSIQRISQIVYGKQYVVHEKKILKILKHNKRTRRTLTVKAMGSKTEPYFQNEMNYGNFPTYSYDEIKHEGTNE